MTNPHYRLHEGDLTIPATWQDQSMQLFRIPALGAGGDASFVITRDYDAASQEPSLYATNQKTSALSKLEGYSLILESALEIDGQAAAVLDYQWHTSAVLLRQRQVYVRCATCMLILTLTARAEGFNAHLGAWEQLVDSLRLRGAAGRPSVASVPSSPGESTVQGGPRYRSSW